MKSVDARSEHLQGQVKKWLSSSQPGPSHPYSLTAPPQLTRPSPRPWSDQPLGHGWEWLYLLCVESCDGHDSLTRWSSGKLVASHRTTITQPPYPFLHGHKVEGRYREYDWNGEIVTKEKGRKEGESMEEGRGRRLISQKGWSRNSGRLAEIA